jgi:hypothetical protein
MALFVAAAMRQQQTKIRDRTRNSRFSPVFAGNKRRVQRRTLSTTSNIPAITALGWSSWMK